MKTTAQDQILYHGDFMKKWQEVEELSVDLLLADPPYGSITRGQPWDVRPDFHVLAWILHKLIKPAGQVAVFSDFLTAIEIHNAFDRYFSFRFNWFWQKPSAIPINHTQPAIDIELIMIYKVKGTKTGAVTFNLAEIRETGRPYTRPAGKTQNNNPTRGNGGNLPEIFTNPSGKRFPRSVLRFANKPCMTKSERTAHPTQKPVALMDYMIRALSNQGDLILDPFMGSATTLVAAHRLKRHGIGFETSEDYFSNARDRLERETAQGVLV